MSEPLIRRINREQMCWRAVDVEQLIEQDHVARTIWDLVGGLDLEGFCAGIGCSEEAGGRRTGAIIDYKIFLKETNSSPQDWDVALAVEYKNHAAMDGLTAKGEAVRDKIMGGKQQAQQVAEKRQEIREIVSSELLQEIMLK